MFDDDRSYYQHRAEIELELAQSAILPKVVHAHYELAQAYLEKLASDNTSKVHSS